MNENNGRNSNALNNGGCKRLAARSERLYVLLNTQPNPGTRWSTLHIFNMVMYSKPKSFLPVTLLPNKVSGPEEVTIHGSLHTFL